MLAIPEPGVDRSPRERPPLGLLARFAALDGLLQPPAGFFVVQQIRPAFLNDLAEPPYAHRLPTALTCKAKLSGRQETAKSRRWPPSTSPVPIFTASGTTRSNPATVQRHRLIPDNPLVSGKHEGLDRKHQRLDAQDHGVHNPDGVDRVEDEAPQRSRCPSRRSRRGCSCRRWRCSCCRAARRQARLRRAARERPEWCPAASPAAGQRTARRRGTGPRR